MIASRDEAYWVSLVREYCKQPAETPWVEFKHNNTDPEMIGELLSAMSNAAALDGKVSAFVIWGVDDKTREVVGTSFVPSTTKKGSQELESWLVQLLNPRLVFHFHSVTVDGKPVVVLEIPRASGKPTHFSGKELIRIGSNRKPLKDHPEQERELWRIFDKTPFEEQVALQDLPASVVLQLLDWQAYFAMTEAALPTDNDGILARLQEEQMIAQNDIGRWDIRNHGAILFARDLNEFPTLARKAVRLIIYKGRDKLNTVREQGGQKGYASGFDGLLRFLRALLPRNEVIETALRKEVPMYPDLAVRELIANALVHQDFSISGTGPMVEVFSDRLEVTNPGVPIVEIDRFLDNPPRSRNEALASFMRRVGICEERGSGVDKIVSQTELFQLPPPRWERPGQALRAILFAPRPLKDMDRNERVHACYLHACLRFVSRDPMTNTSLRERFRIEKQNSANASRIIRDALDAEMIKPYEEDQAKKNSRYLPYWA